MKTEEYRPRASLFSRTVRSNRFGKFSLQKYLFTWKVETFNKKFNNETTSHLGGSRLPAEKHVKGFVYDSCSSFGSIGRQDHFIWLLCRFVSSLSQWPYSSSLDVRIFFADDRLVGAPCNPDHQIIVDYFAVVQQSFVTLKLWRKLQMDPVAWRENFLDDGSTLREVSKNFRDDALRESENCDPKVAVAVTIDRRACRRECRVESRVLLVLTRVIEIGIWWRVWDNRWHYSRLIESGLVKSRPWAEDWRRWTEYRRLIMKRLICCIHIREVLLLGYEAFCRSLETFVTLE